MQKASKIWLNGQLVDWDKATIHVLTHGLHYGTGVFEGLRCFETVNGPALFRMHDHVKRLFDSAKIYMMDMRFGFDDICDAIILTVKSNNIQDCYVRPIAYYGYGKMGVTPFPNKVDVAIAVWKWDEYLKVDSSEGIKCMISSWRRIDSRTMPVQAKATANYANSALSRIEALKSGYDEGIMLNTDGMVAESSAENIFIANNGSLMTPPTTAGALAGITRNTILEIAKKNDIKCEIANITRDELYIADEVFLTGTAAGIKPVIEIDRRTIGDGKTGVMTKELQRMYEQVVRGKDSRFSKWLIRAS
ncbi:MAG: branched-chain amino acid aminotransferase [Candidatus Nitrosomirales archaeon]|jgi:branched-chain amino acid aminotransferase